jgi:drug/metabolite transporter (DMT)-like permease
VCVCALQSVKYLENLCFDPPCNHPPSEAALARFGLAALVSIPLLVGQKWNVVKAGLECGLWIALGYASQAMALSTIDSGKCAFICSLTVVFVPVLSAVVYNKPIKGSNILAAMVALAGVGVLEGLVDVNAILLGIPPAVAADTVTAHSSGLAEASATATAALVSSSTLHMANTASAVVEATSTTGPIASLAQSLGVSKGDILALGQPIGFGTAFTRIERYQEELKDVPNRILTIAAAQCVAVGVMSFFWVLYDFHGVIPNMAYMMEPHRVATIVWTGIVTTVVAIYIEGLALQKATATDASLAFSTEPVWASLFGFFLLHETIGSESYIGGSIILMACVIGAVSDLLAENNDKAGTDSLTETKP